MSFFMYMFDMYIDAVYVCMVSDASIDDVCSLLYD